MRTHTLTLTLSLVAVAMVGTLGTVASAQRGTGSTVVMPKYDTAAEIADLPFYGRWRINVAKSTQNGSRANSDTFTWIFKREGDMVRHDIYDVYPAVDSARARLFAPNSRRTASGLPVRESVGSRRSKVSMYRPKRVWFPLIW